MESKSHMSTFWNLPIFLGCNNNNINDTFSWMIILYVWLSLKKYTWLLSMIIGSNHSKLRTSFSTAIGIHVISVFPLYQSKDPLNLTHPVAYCHSSLLLLMIGINFFLKTLKLYSFTSVPAFNGLFMDILICLIN